VSRLGLRVVEGEGEYLQSIEVVGDGGGPAVGDRTMRQRGTTSAAGGKAGGGWGWRGR
jgi:hypothetical protein